MILFSFFEASIRLETFLPLNSAMGLTGMFCVVLAPVGKLVMKLRIGSLSLAYTYKGHATITSVHAESL